MATSTDLASQSSEKTHDVLNQVPPLTGYNLFLTDRTLVEAVRREGAAWAEGHIAELGHLLGTEEAQRWGFDANENKPVLHTHDSAGNRRDEVVFHPAWHSLMRTSVGRRLHSLPWEYIHHGGTEARRTAEAGRQGKKGMDGTSSKGAQTARDRPGSHVARAALMMITVQNEAGHTCPISMTFSGMAALQAEPELAAEWAPKLMSPTYDPRFLPVQEKSGALLGMGMTEKQGGSDVRANTTRAERIGDHGRGREFLITGHKWFVSAPMCDAFLVLAQAPKGLTCFLLPRWTPTGEKNNFHVQRLKDKMGNRANASSEVEFARAWARQVGEEGRGVNTIIEMVNHTRLDCAIASAGLMRQALVQALHHCRNRKAFGKLLIDQPLMRHVLADLTVESEAATLMIARLARAFDDRDADGSSAAGSMPGDRAPSGSANNARAFSRVATAICKYWLCKRSPAHVGEALECLGGNGYVEESIMPRLYREAPLYGIWEGSGNVICLDVLRALSKDPGTAEALVAEFKTAAGADTRLDKFLAAVQSDLNTALHNAAGASAENESRARWLTERLALALQATLIVRHGRKEVAEAFVASRIAGDHGHNFGTLPAGTNVDAIVAQ